MASRCRHVHQAEKNFNVQSGQINATGVVSNLQKEQDSPQVLLLPAGAPSLSSATRPPAGPPKSGGRQTREAPKWASSLAQASPQLHGNIPHPPRKERFLSGFGLKKKKKKRVSRWGVGWANSKQGTGSEAAEGPGYPERSVLLGRGFKAT